MPNRLAEETSPYLLQHKENPVDWRPWGPEALAEAKRSDQPLLVSIGYSSCHWCHVMERESFEDETTAALMNERFICVKVDREERPDVDAIYMDAVQSMTGQGGWPLTVFCDSDGVPFYGGTYFPPEPRQGMPSFREVLVAISDAYSERRDEIAEAADSVRERLSASSQLGSGSAEQIGAAMLDAAQANLVATLDRANGGFGGAPKFPPSGTLEFLLSRGEGEATTVTLDGMLHGGLFDQVGGGFARYSVDERWLVPHFEKMLYDNALLARCYLHGWQLFGHERWRRACELTLDWALSEMRGSEGGFFSALDADSGGEEGLFYVWGEAEAREALAAGGLDESEVEQMLGYWGVSPGGNFEGRNVLHVAAGAAASPPATLERARAAMLAQRDQRERPGLDDKRLCSWNALMISALADAGPALGRADLVQAAGECAEFVLAEMRDSDGRLLRTWKDGRGSLGAYLEDHAFLLEALLDLHAATFEPRWFTEARGLADTIRERFEDAENGGFFSTAHDHERLIARRKEFSDHPIPSATASAALGLLRIAALSGERSYEDAAVAAIAPLAGAAAKHPDSFGHLLQAMAFLLSPPRELALVRPADAPDAGALGALVGSRFLPNVAVGGGPTGSAEPPLMADRDAVDGKTTAYLCERFSCRAPIDDPEELRVALDGLGPVPA